VPTAGNVGKACASPAGFEVSTFLLSTWPPVRNENVSFNMTGTFTASETINALVINVIYGGVPFYQEVLDRTGTYAKGANYKDGYTAFFPTITPSGNYAVNLQLRNTANAYISCWEVTFSL
jgi:hypothetical protein